MPLGHNMRMQLELSWADLAFPETQWSPVLQDSFVCFAAGQGLGCGYSHGEAVSQL